MIHGIVRGKRHTSGQIRTCCALFFRNLPARLSAVFVPCFALKQDSWQLIPISLRISNFVGFRRNPLQSWWVLFVLSCLFASTKWYIAGYLQYLWHSIKVAKIVYRNYIVDFCRNGYGRHLFVRCWLSTRDADARKRDLLTANISLESGGMQTRMRTHTRAASHYAYCYSRGTSLVLCHHHQIQKKSHLKMVSIVYAYIVTTLCTDYRGSSSYQSVIFMQTFHCGQKKK